MQPRSDKPRPMALTFRRWLMAFETASYLVDTLGLEVSWQEQEVFLPDGETSAQYLLHVVCTHAQAKEAMEDALFICTDFDCALILAGLLEPYIPYEGYA